MSANPNECPLVLLAPEHSRRLEIALDSSRPLPASEREEHIQFLREMSAGPAQRRSGKEVDRLMGLLDELDRKDRFQ